MTKTAAVAVALSVLAIVLAETGEPARKEGEEEQVFLARIAQALNDLPDAKYKALPKPVKRWGNDAAAAINDEKPLPVISDAVDPAVPEADPKTDAEEPAAPETAKKPKGSKKADKPAKKPKGSKKAAKTAKGKKPAKAGKKPAKTGVRRGRSRSGVVGGELADFRRQVIADHFSEEPKTQEELEAAFTKGGGKLSHHSMTAAFCSTRQTLKILADKGLLKKPAAE